MKRNIFPANRYNSIPTFLRKDSIWIQSDFHKSQFVPSASLVDCGKSNPLSIPHCTTHQKIGLKLIACFPLIGMACFPFNRSEPYVSARDVISAFFPRLQSFHRVQKLTLPSSSLVVVLKMIGPPHRSRGSKKIKP